jgi:hypothetical protein
MTTLVIHEAADAPIRALAYGNVNEPATVVSPDTPLPVLSGSQLVWSAGFSAVGSSVLDSRFNAPRVGTGVTYNQGSGSLNILSGTTTNAEFLAKSIQSFAGSMRMRFTATLSQRIANNNFAILLADSISDNAAYNIINATTIDITVPSHGFDATMIGQFALLGGITGAAGVPGRYAIASIPDSNTLRFTVSGWPASGTGTLCLFGRNYVRNLFTSTTATNVAVDAQRNGWATGDTTATINTTASPGVLIANELTGRDVFFSDALRATSTTPTFATRASRYENIPDQTVELFVFIWSFNGTAAPASTTTLTLGHIAVESFPNNPVYIQGFRAQGATNPIPATIQGGTLPTVTTVSTVAALTGGGAAEDAAAGANPVTIGGVVRDTNAPTTLVAGDAARLTMSRGAAAIVKPYSVAEAGWNGSVSLTTTTATALIGAAAAGLKRHLTAIQAINTGAAAVDLIILDGATERWRLTLPINIPVFIAFPTELTATAATALNVNLSAVSTGVRVNGQGYTSA